MVRVPWTEGPPLWPSPPVENLRNVVATMLVLWFPKNIRQWARLFPIPPSEKLTPHPPVASLKVPTPSLATLTPEIFVPRPTSRCTARPLRVGPSPRLKNPRTVPRNVRLASCVVFPFIPMHRVTAPRAILLRKALIFPLAKRGHVYLLLHKLRPIRVAQQSLTASGVPNSIVPRHRPTPCIPAAPLST